MKNVSLNVEGMSCEHCVKAVSDAIAKFPGTEKIQVNLKGGTATFTYDETQASLAEIKTAIGDQGYDLK